MTIRRLLTLGATLAALAVPAQAQDTAEGFDLQLNGADDSSNGTSCRLTYVATNRSESALSRTAFEVAIFNADGVVTRLLVLEFGELIAGKTKVVQFNLGGGDCSSLSRIVVNDVAACTVEGTDGIADICRSGLSTSSLADIEFGL